MGACWEGCLGVLLSSEPITHGPIVAVGSATAATIWMRGTAEGAVRVTFWPSDEKASQGSVMAWLDANADFTGRARLTGLRPGTQYSFGVHTGTSSASRHGSFRTPGLPTGGGDSSKCSFVFGSCVGGQGYGRVAGDGPESGFAAFTAMAGCKPDFFMCNGDFIYADNAIEAVGSMPWNKGTSHVVGEGMAVASDLDGFRARYRYHLADDKLAAFLASTSLLSTWDDHEIVDDWGAEKMRAAGQGALLEAGQRAWFEYQPHEGPSAEPRRVYRTVRWGAHVELFVLDCRLPNRGSNL